MLQANGPPTAVIPSELARPLGNCTHSRRAMPHDYATYR
jgi:hypothetical protein